MPFVSAVVARSRGVVLICLTAGLATICVLKAGLASLVAVYRSGFMFRERESLVRRRGEVRAGFVEIGMWKERCSSSLLPVNASL